eukprot:365049-Chlamydomonas_euryale.AAC.3
MHVQPSQLLSGPPQKEPHTMLARLEHVHSVECLNSKTNTWDALGPVSLRQPLCLGLCSCNQHVGPCVQAWRNDQPRTSSPPPPRIISMLA